MTKQYLFPHFEKLKIKSFGGSTIKGNAREQRPIAIKRPMHLVLRSSHAVGQLSFLNRARAQKIRELVHRTAKAKGVKIHRYASAGNHLHLIVQTCSRQAFFAFIRAISGLIARLTLGVEKGRGRGLKFWDALPFTRILEWGKDFVQTSNYLGRNILEALGFIPYQPRGRQTIRARPAPT